MDLPKSFLYAALCRRKVDLASPYLNFYHKIVLTPGKSANRTSGSQYLTHPITTVMGFVGEEEVNLCSLLLVHYSLPTLFLTLGRNNLFHSFLSL
jgi:hypothetical protein